MSSQVPGTSSSQVPETSSSEVPVEKKVVKKTNEKLSRLKFDRPNPLPHHPGESIGGRCLEFHKQNPQTYIFIMAFSKKTLTPLLNFRSMLAHRLRLRLVHIISKKIRIASTCPPNTGHSPNAVSMVGQRRRRWANNIETAMGE